MVCFQGQRYILVNVYIDKLLTTLLPFICAGYSTVFIMCFALTKDTYVILLVTIRDKGLFSISGNLLKGKRPSNT